MYSFAAAFFHFKKLYNNETFATPYVAGESTFTHAQMRSPALRAAEWMAKNSNGRTPVYLYLWAHRDEVMKVFEPSWLIGHSS